MVAIDSSPRVRARRNDSFFFPLMTAAIAVIVFAGFAPTFYLRQHFNGPPLSLLKILHGTAFSAWVALLIVQTGLVAANRRDIHRKLGVAGALLAVIMMVLGLWLGIDALRRGITAPGSSPVATFAIPVISMVTFTLLVGLGVLNRQRLGYHKRYMLLSTGAIWGAAIGRLPLAMVQSGAFGVIVLSDSVLVAMIVYDLATSRRVHPATLWSGAILIGSGFLPPLFADTVVWRDFASLLM